MLLADRPTTSRWTPSTGRTLLSSQADPRRQEPRPTLRAQDTLAGSQIAFESGLGSAFEPNASPRPRRQPQFNTGIALSVSSPRSPTSGLGTRRSGRSGGTQGVAIAVAQIGAWGLGSSAADVGSGLSRHQSWGSRAGAGTRSCLRAGACRAERHDRVVRIAPVTAKDVRTPHMRRRPSRSPRRIGCGCRPPVARGGGSVLERRGRNK
jgi:hypothetical protein